MMFSSCQSADGIDGGRGRSISVVFISIRSCSRSPTPFCPSLRLPDTRNGTGDCLLSLVPLSSLVAVIDCIADGDGVSIDSV